MAPGPLLSKIGVSGTQALRCPMVDLTTGACAARTNGGRTGDSRPGGLGRAGAILRHVTQSGTQFTLCGFPTIFHFMFSDHNWLQLTETRESGSTDRAGLPLWVTADPRPGKGCVTNYPRRANGPQVPAQPLATAGPVLVRCSVRGPLPAHGFRLRPSRQGLGFRVGNGTKQLLPPGGDSPAPVEPPIRRTFPSQRLPGVESAASRAQLLLARSLAAPTPGSGAAQATERCSPVKPPRTRAGWGEAAGAQGCDPPRRILHRSFGLAPHGMQT